MTANKILPLADITYRMGTWGDSKMKTNLNMVKDKAIQLIYIEPQKEEGFNVCQHPYINTPVINSIDTNKPFNIFQDIEAYHRWQEQFKEEITHRKNVYSVFSLIRPAYRLTFFKHINQYLSNKDFAEILALCWSAHGGTEIPEAELEAWFKKADKNFLMSKREQKIFNELPEQVTVYRGVRSPECKYGFSWTLDKDIAFWYSDGCEGGQACVYECVADKKDVCSYFNTRNEAEIVIAPSILKEYRIKKIK